MSSYLANIADAVVTSFNAQDFGVGAAARRIWVPRLDLKSFASTEVLVRAFAGDGQMISRARRADDVTVDIAVLHGKVSSDDVDTLDIWMEHCERIRDFFRGSGARLFSTPPAAFTSVELRDVVENLKMFRVFTGVVRCKGQMVIEV